MTFKTAVFGNVIDATDAESPPPKPETSSRCPPFAQRAIVTGTVAEAELPTSSALTSNLSSAGVNVTNTTPPMSAGGECPSP